MPIPLKAKQGPISRSNEKNRLEKGDPLIVIKVEETDSKECLDNWFHHFSTLLGKREQTLVDLREPFYKDKVSDQLPIDTKLFSIAKL